MQTAKILEALYLPLYARAERQPPDAEDLMPDRFAKPKKSVLGPIMAAAQNGQVMAEQFKAMVGGK